MNEEREKQLSRIVIKGFKSIKECELDLGNINVLIGANGAGKSNFLSAFELLEGVVGRSLAHYAGKKGIETLLYNGKEATDSILVELHFDEDSYSFELEWTENNSLILRSESLILDGKEMLGDGGHSESTVFNKLLDLSIYDKNGLKLTKNVSNTFLQQLIKVYRFQNTTASSNKKSEQSISNDINLTSEGQNLAAFLYRLKRFYAEEYGDILRATQLVAPFFDDFVLEPKELNDEQIILKWRKKGCEDVFNAAQFSDGTLRFICLATLLLQPTELQPSTIIIDEPELGLHPFAITILAEMVKKTAVDKQVILATQSVELLDNFNAENVIVVDHGEEGSEFKRLDGEAFEAWRKMWLDNDYTLGELWNMNTFGGRP